MDKALNMGKSSATGSFQLLIGVVASTVIMALGTLIFGWLLTRDQLGLYGVALIPSSMINFFRDWGVNSAMTKQIASLRAAHRESEIHDVIVSGVVFEVISGAVLSAICFAIAGPLAFFLKMPEASTLISIMSVSIFAGAIIAAAGAIFVGFEKMMLNSLTTILQSVIKTAIGPLLVILGFSVLGAIIGTAVSFLAGGAIGIALVYVVLFRQVRKLRVGECDIRKTLKPMLSFGVPLMVSNLVVGVSPLLFAFLMAPVAGAALMGDYYAASYFTVLLTFFTIPISTALFPTFAKVNPQKEPELLRTVFASSVKYTSLLVVPSTMIIMALSSPIVNTLWPGKFPFAPLFLSISVIVNLLVVVGNVSLATLMSGIGETRKLMIQSMFSIACSIPIILLLILYSTNLTPMLGALIGIAGIQLATVPGMIWGLVWISKRYRVKPDYGVSVKILAASIIAGVVSYLALSLPTLFLQAFGLSVWVTTVASLVFGFFIFLVVFLASAPLVGAVNQTDIDNLRAMFSGLGIVSKILEIPLKFMWKMQKFKGNPTNQVDTSK
jgi:stage V sporulation protein B